MGDSTGQKDFLNRLASAGEDAIGRLAELPGGQRVLEAVHSLRDRVDDLQRRTLGIEPLERRVADLEARVGALDGGSTAEPAAGPAADAPAADEPSVTPVEG